MFGCYPRYSLWYGYRVGDKWGGTGSHQIKTDGYIMVHRGSIDLHVDEIWHQSSFCVVSGGCDI